MIVCTSSYALAKASVTAFYKAKVLHEESIDISQASTAMVLINVHQVIPVFRCWTTILKIPFSSGQIGKVAWGVWWKDDQAHGKNDSLPIIIIDNLTFSFSGHKYQKNLQHNTYC